MEEMIKAFSTKKLQDAIDGFVIELNDDNTNEVRKYLDKLPHAELIEVKIFSPKETNYDEFNSKDMYR